MTPQRTRNNPDTTRGVAFPVVDGRRSTTATGRAVFAAAARVVDDRLADAIATESDWRRRYLVHARRLLEARLRDPRVEPVVASAGLASLHRRFVFATGDGDLPLHDAPRGVEGPRIDTVSVQGGASPRGDAAGGLVVPYRGDMLRGQALHRRLDSWVAAGTVEASFAEAVRAVVANPDWLDLADQQVVLLGAGAEMGPLAALCRWGAHVLPVDLPDPNLWGRILRAVREGRGRASVPVRAGSTPGGARDAARDDVVLAGAAGADVVADLPGIAAWLDTFDGVSTVGNHVYADGATHARAAVAADALTAHLAGGADVALAMLATPTDVFAAPEDAVRMACRRFAEPRTRPLPAAVRTVTRGRLFAPNYDDLVSTPQGVRVGVADCLVAQQGPNYALAKRLQRWRASVARADGAVVSINVAPPTRTRSVLRNRVLAAAYAGAARFGVETFAPATSSTLMAALLVHDLRNPGAAAHPGAPLAHPLQLFSQGANHGGLWRIPFAPRSVLGLAVVVGLGGAVRRQPHP